MKKVTIKDKTYKIPDRFIAAAYAGACAGHQVIEHKKMFGKKRVDWKSHFRHIYGIVLKNIRSIVKSLPHKMSLKELLNNSPANKRYGGL